jgi:hypothetical protein
VAAEMGAEIKFCQNPFLKFFDVFIWKGIFSIYECMYIPMYIGMYICSKRGTSIYWTNCAPITLVQVKTIIRKVMAQWTSHPPQTLVRIPMGYKVFREIIAVLFFYNRMKCLVCVYLRK